MDITLKRCTKCGEEKPATPEFFYRQLGGLQASCKACAKAARANPTVRERENAWKRANRDKLRPRAREWRQRNRERENARGLAWRLANPGKQAEASARWEAAHLEWRREYAREYRTRPGYAERKRAHDHKRRAQTLEGVTAEDIARKLEAQQGICWWCGKPHGENWHLDHVVPLARGGEHSVANTVVACRRCNQRKYAKMPLEFAGRLF